MLHQQEAMNDSRAFKLPETRVKQVERHERDSVSTITFPRLFLSMLKVPLPFPFLFLSFFRYFYFAQFACALIVFLWMNESFVDG